LAANQQTIEKRLTEFTEVHGTVLLGMHRELKSLTKNIDDKIGDATKKLQDYAEQTQNDFIEKIKHINERREWFNEQLNQYSVESTQRDETVNLLIERHAAKIQATERRITEDAERAGFELAKLLERTSVDTKALVDTASLEANGRLQLTICSFEEAFDGFINHIADAEAKVLAYTFKQQQLLDIQAQEIRAMHHETKELLRQIHTKIETLHQRELSFFRKLRQTLLGIAIAICIAVVLGVWKPWIN
jgi:hypothetical protein